MAAQSSTGNVLNGKVCIVGRESEPRMAGKQLEEMTIALLDAANDRESNVQKAISTSLYELGRKQPATVLYCCYRYLSQCSKISQSHRIIVLATMERIIGETVDTIGEQLALDVIALAGEELTKSKEVIPEWQTAASGVLVAIGTKFCNEVMDVLVQKVQPGSLPHFFVVQTLGNLAQANVFGIIPYLSVIMGTMLPMLTLSKQDNMRWVFANAFSKFSYAIQDYMANIERAPDSTVRKEVFSNEVNAAYEILFNVWLQTKEAKLRNVIVEALGNMASIMTKQKLEEQLPKLLPGILNIYKKQADPHLITQGLCLILEAATADQSRMLEVQLENLLNLLFTQVCQPPDYTNQQNVRNYNELLRCFAVLTRSFSDRIVGFLLQKLDNTNERVRIGALSIFRHVINSGGEHMEDKKSLIVSGLKMVLLESNNKVKKVFAQLIIAMADHGYLRLEGGHLMVDFIIKHCALEDSPPSRRLTDVEFVSNEALRGMCDNILQLISSTIECMHSVLWPYILEFTVQEQYTEAMVSICKCIVNLTGKKVDDEGRAVERHISVDYSEFINAPKEVALIARLMVMMGCPLNGRKRGLHVLQAFKLLSPHLHENMVEMVNTVVPKLIHYLEDGMEHEEKWSQKNWEDLLLKMLSKMLDEVDDEEWIKNLGDAMVQQIGLYGKASDEKNFLYKSLGVVMRKSSKKDFIQLVLDAMFNSVRHNVLEEREGCAVAFGFCGSTHLDIVIGKLESVNRALGNRRSSGLLGFMKDSKNVEGDPEKIKATVMLSYGYVTLYGSPTLIVSRVEGSILRTIEPHFSNVKDESLRLGLIKSVDLIGRALHPKHLQSNHTFSKKVDLINHMVSYIKAEPSNQIHDDTRRYAFEACAALVQLDPPLGIEEEDELMKTCFDSFLPLPPGGQSKKMKEESYSEFLEKDSVMSQTLDALRSLLKAAMIKEVSPAHLENLCKHVSPWMISTVDQERVRAMACLQTLIKSYLESMTVGLGGPNNLSNAGVLLGRVIPRCTDPDNNVRQYAIDCIHTVFLILLRYEGHDPDYEDSLVKAVPTLKDRLGNSDATSLYSVITDLSKVFSKKLPSDQLVSFTETLYDGLLDVQSHSSSAACVVLNTMFKSRGGELYSHVDRIVTVLHTQLSQVQFPTTRTGTLRAIRVLASHHLLPSLSSLLDFPLPFDDSVNDIWQSLAMDGQLTQNILDYILDMLSRALPYEEVHDSRDRTTKYACTSTLAAVSALCQIFKVEETADEVKQNFDKLFSALLILIGAMNGTGSPKPKDKKHDMKEESKKTTFGLKKKECTTKEAMQTPCAIVVEAFHQLLTRAGCVKILDDLDQYDAWRTFETADFVDAVTVLGESLAVNESSHLARIIAQLNPAMTCVYEGERQIVAALFAELIRLRCAGDMVLVELIMNSLLARMVDNDYKVRMLSIRGLGNVAAVGPSQVQKFSTTVLSAMMSGMEDKNDPNDDITLESMSGLSKILAEIDENAVRPILLNIALRIRPCFEKERSEVRAAAFTLFGSLSSFGDGPSKSLYLEQIHTNFISLLTHLNDPNRAVVRACKDTLRKIGRLMGSDEMNNMFQKVLLDNANLHYGEFINDLTKIMIKDFADKVNTYLMNCVVFFKSCWPEIQCNAVTLAGFLLGNLPLDLHANISKQHMCGSLVQLLKDKEPSVRAKTAEAISLLDQV